MIRYTSNKIKARELLEQNKSKDHFVILKDSTIMLSAPHCVSQTRLGKHKIAERGTLPFALSLQENNNVSLIFKTKNNFDDANFDEVSKYKSKLKSLVESENISHIIDFHGLAKTRTCDVNLGIHLGQNISNDIKLFDKLVADLRKNGFIVDIDIPFSANIKTISGSMKLAFNHLWTIQVEINCDITNNPKNLKKCKLLASVFDNWIKEIK